MKTLLARIMLLTYNEADITDRIRYLFDLLLKLSPVVFVLNLINWWFTENQQFGTFMCIALLINMGVGVYYHFKKGTFQFKPFIFKNLEMCFVVVVVYMMLEMLRYTAGDNLAGEIFRILIQITTLLYPTSKVMKNVFIITKGKYPPKFIMDKLYNFEKNGDLNDFFKTSKENQEGIENE